SLQIAKAGKPHTIFEEPYLPLAKELTRIKCGEKAAKQLDLLPPLKDTVPHRTIDMADDIKRLSVCKPLPTGITGEHIFQLLNEFIKENGIDWIKCVRVCTDGARAMTSRHSGVVARIREVAPEMNGHIAKSTARPLPSSKCLTI
ncbi:ZMYM6 protein, partial [Atractosteus spatula]|nr:ZMYM6 protein [Atractosteus spatula]